MYIVKFTIHFINIYGLKWYLHSLMESENCERILVVLMFFCLAQSLYNLFHDELT